MTRDTIQIFREPSGMVHIEAQKDEDLFFALGYAHASDRLLQMDLQRRLAQGRLSEVIGDAALQRDIFSRTLGLTQAATSAYRHLAPAVKQVVEAYAQGINHFLKTQPLPLEFFPLDYEPEPWRPVDILTGIKLQSLGLSTNVQAELLRTQLIAQGFSLERIQQLFPPYTGDITILQPEEIELIPGIRQTSSASKPGFLSHRSTQAISGKASPSNLRRVGGFAAHPPQITGCITSWRPSKDAGFGLESEAKLALSWDDLFAPMTQASNNWVVSGDRTTTGKPFLANDPHLTLQLPSLWYTAHLTSPNFEVIGATFPGLPGFPIGRNRRIAWGVTNLQADTQDLYALVEPPDNNTGYLFNGEFLPYQTRIETIKVRGLETEITLPVRESHYGPVVSDALGLDQPLALRWVSLEPEDGTLEAYLGVNRATNWRQFTRALQSYVAPGQNFVYADVQGNIGYFAPGKFPIRQPGHTGLVPVAGTGEFDWQGFIPFDQLPQVYNPASGFIVSANNRVASDHYPYPLSFEWAEPYRAERIRQLITRKDKLSLKDMQTIQLDQTTLLYRDFKPILQQLQPILRSFTPLPRETLRWLNRLLDWNGHMKIDSQEATVFQSWYNDLTKVVARALGQEVLNGSLQEPMPRFLLQALTQGDPLFGQTPTEALTRAATILKRTIERFDAPIPRWGEIHQAVFDYLDLPLIRRQVPFGGDRFTVNVGPYNSETLLMTGNGPSYRQIIDFSDLENSRFIYPTGQSGNPLSPDFDNLLPLWQQGDYLLMRTKDYPIATEITLLSPKRDRLIQRRTTSHKQAEESVSVAFHGDQTITISRHTWERQNPFAGSFEPFSPYIIDCVSSLALSTFQ